MEEVGSSPVHHGLGGRGRLQGLLGFPCDRGWNPLRGVTWHNGPWHHGCPNIWTNYNDQRSFRKGPLQKNSLDSGQRHSNRGKPPQKHSNLPSGVPFRQLTMSWLSFTAKAIQTLEGQYPPKASLEARPAVWVLLVRVGFVPPTDGQFQALGLGACDWRATQLM